MSDTPITDAAIERGECGPDLCRQLERLAKYAVVTRYDYPPIPERAWDWSATLGSYDGAPDAKGPNSLIGRGPTEAAAVADLMEQLEGSGD